MSSLTFDFGVLGAGIAGVSLTHELQKSGASVILADTKSVASGGSGAPMGLVNPATGRYATKTWRAESGYEIVRKNLELIQNQTKDTFHKVNGVLRPAMDRKIARRMKENVEQQDWPDGWIEWLDEHQVQELHPGITCVDGGVWLPDAITVDMGAYVRNFAKYLNKLASVNVLEHISPEVSYDSSGFIISDFESNNIRVDKLIYTSGYYSLFTDLWNELPLIPVKGQLALMRYDGERFPFQHSVSALGYTTTLGEKEFVVGSSYEHKFEHEQPDEQGLDYLMKRFGRVLPGLQSNSSVIGRWAGVRASTPNRKPIMGAHPEIDNAFIYAGLGSKGLLYGGLLARDMADFLFNKSTLHPEVNINRLK